MTETGVEVARGLINYSSFEAEKISGLLSEQIEKELGYMEEPEVIHKDNLILISSSFEDSKLSEPTPVKLSNKRVFKLNYHVGSFGKFDPFPRVKFRLFDCGKLYLCRDH